MKKKIQGNLPIYNILLLVLPFDQQKAFFSHKINTIRNWNLQSYKSKVQLELD